MMKYLFIIFFNSILVSNVFAINTDVLLPNHPLSGQEITLPGTYIGISGGIEANNLSDSPKVFAVNNLLVDIEFIAACLFLGFREVTASGVYPQFTKFRVVGVYESIPGFFLGLINDPVRFAILEDELKTQYTIYLAKSQPGQLDKVLYAPNECRYPSCQVWSDLFTAQLTYGSGFIDLEVTEKKPDEKRQKIKFLHRYLLHNNIRVIHHEINSHKYTISVNPIELANFFLQSSYLRVNNVAIKE